MTQRLSIVVSVAICFLSFSAVASAQANGREVTSVRAPSSAHMDDGTASIPVVAQSVSALQEDNGQRAAVENTVNYVEYFYPLWFTYNQWNYGGLNKLTGPRRMTPVYHLVVAPNDDTLYGNSPMDLSTEPIILTIPKTKATFSVLTLDAFGDVFQTGISETSEGVYGLTGPGWQGTLPPNVTQIPIPYNYIACIIRSDKFSPTGEDQRAIAEIFRRKTRAETLSEYLTNPNGGATRIVPVAAFGVPFKEIADRRAKNQSLTFAQELQAAVHSPYGQPYSQDAQELSDAFDALLAGGNANAQIMKGVQLAHAAIEARYLTHTDLTRWISFNNIGDWGDAFLDRSSISEFIQYGNALDTAAYFQTFQDASGNVLDGSVTSEYILRFPKWDIPQTKRFWSVTAYLPGSITLIRNDEQKYVVASYTPGLVTDSDGSITIYISPSLPEGVPAANWLPVPQGQFNIMLRDYGPTGSAGEGTYIPPPIIAAQ